LSFAAVAKGALELSKRTKETYPYRWILVILYNAIPYVNSKSAIELKSLIKSASKIVRAGVEFLYDTL